MAAPFPSPTKTWHNNTYSAIAPSRPELSAKGKTVVITGGGSGIGAEAARSFAEAGAARIVLLGRRKQPLLDTKVSIEAISSSVQVLVQPTDVTKKSEVDAAFRDTVGDGKVDILVSNAAMVGPLEPVIDADVEKFMAAIDAMVVASVLVAQAFHRYASANAIVIETNSSAAHLNFANGFTAYSAAKLAVFRIWDSFGYGNPSISVFHVQPGVVDTEMNKEAGGVAHTGIEDHVSLPGNFYVWLASSEAAFLKGKFVWVNWDVEELKTRAKEIQDTTLLSVGLVGWPFGQESWATPWKS